MLIGSKYLKKATEKRLINWDREKNNLSPVRFNCMKLFKRPVINTFVKLSLQIRGAELENEN